MSSKKSNPFKVFFYLTRYGEVLVKYWVVPEKIHTPTTEGMLENLTGGGVNGSGNSDVRGALNLKIHPRG